MDAGAQPPTGAPVERAAPTADGAGVHVVVGAGGATGRRLVAHLHAAGCRVRAVTRDGRDVGTPGVETAAADATDGVGLAAACRGAAAVHHCVMPVLARWTSDFPVVTDALVDAASRAGARLVYADDTWMYGRVDGPMTEDSPWRPVSAKGVLRAWVAERVLHAAAAGRLQVSVVRAGELYGPGVRSLVAGNVFRPALRGWPVQWVGDPDLPLTPTFIGDFAATLAAVGTRDSSDASVWHVPHPPATTGRALAAEACRQAGTRLRLVSHGSARVRLLGHVLPLAREGAEMVYQFEQPFVVDGAPAARAFAITPTPYEQGVRQTLAALRGSGREAPTVGSDGGPSAAGGLGPDRRSGHRPSPGTAPG
ncbi:Nucleoside-diphosphate-sugar epimerase [Geodermatophilus pulveris]|uniref:Nucleoside-diphosphate-sugar epimerase n=1 Tax=Geodermatophilus pulveris TaxID=1564159 RepID=A0A239C543_9ACTN|nr:NAD-dependent epimerase/dehydratase family protein [Geodermatophilus pulveris]SNS14798.1 Nucleoside-diphosphate-sugar epimerase [Geodermatophilus pulveris]